MPGRVGRNTRKLRLFRYTENRPSQLTMPTDNEEDGNRRGPLVALGVVVVLFALGWFLARELYANGKLEDCLMSGRTNCAPIDTPPR
jgi:hypothetical protein